MPDVFDREKRLEIMKRVKPNKNKTTELRLIQIFNELGITGWRRNYNVKGHPDFVFSACQVAIFVDGCFWHGHDCRNTIPKKNAEYWDKKRANNIQHDKAVTKLFENRRWTVLRIWECELKKKHISETIEKLKKALLQADAFLDKHIEQSYRNGAL